jgi:transcriptional regulator with XRE-family HTH domain
MTTIGSKLLKLRNSRNLSVNTLAFELDIPQPTLHRIESDITHKIDFKHIIKFSEFFGVELDYFVDEKTKNVVKKNTNGVGIGNHNVINNYNEKKPNDLRHNAHDENLGEGED